MRATGLGFRARAFNVQDDFARLQQALRRKAPDVIFNLIEFFHDNSKLEAMVAGLYELYKIPYTGAPPFALSLCQRKGLTKQVLLANGDSLMASSVTLSDEQLVIEPGVATAAAALPTAGGRRDGHSFPISVPAGYRIRGGSPGL